MDSWVGAFSYNVLKDYHDLILTKVKKIYSGIYIVIQWRSERRGHMRGICVVQFDCLGCWLAS